MRGREDNAMYRINDGYNLDSNDKTYFDKYNIFEMISGSRSRTTMNTYGSSPRYTAASKNSKFTKHVVKKMTDQIESAGFQEHGYDSDSAQSYEYA